MRKALNAFVGGGVVIGGVALALLVFYGIGSALTMLVGGEWGVGWTVWWGFIGSAGIAAATGIVTTLVKEWFEPLGREIIDDVVKPRPSAKHKIQTRDPLIGAVSTEESTTSLTPLRLRPTAGETVKR